MDEAAFPSFFSGVKEFWSLNQAVFTECDLFLFIFLILNEQQFSE